MIALSACSFVWLPASVKIHTHSQKKKKDKLRFTSLSPGRIFILVVVSLDLFVLFDWLQCSNNDLVAIKRNFNIGIV